MPTPYKPKFILDGKEVDKITAFLFHAGGHEDPKRLAANAGKSFIGSYILGMGRQFKSEVQQVLMPQRILHEACDSQEIFLVYG